MTLRCTSRYTSLGAQCQDRQHPNGLHHGHTDDQCLQWADGGVHFSKPISECPWPPAHEVARRAEELGAMVKVRRERILAAAVENPDSPLLRAAVEKLRGEEAPATGGLGLYPAHEQRLADDYTPDWRTISLAEQHLGFIDPNLTVAVQDLWAQNAARGVEIDRLRAAWASARRRANQSRADYDDANQVYLESRSSLIGEARRAHDRANTTEAENARLRARLTAMAEAWKTDLPDTIRTAVAAEALLTTLEG